jgi:acetyl-CoA carboxylase biotin carboxyl carrier protein
MIRRKSAGKGDNAATPAGARSATAPPADPELARVRELARIATEFDLSEVELEPAGRIRLQRRVAGASAPAHATVAHAPHASPAPLSGLLTPPAAASAAEKADENAVFVTSPFVGTFYLAPSPEAPAFIAIGQAVRKGQVVCIIEAMKLMNEIESDVDGRVEAALVGNGEHVEYGQKLFRLSRT